MPSLAEPRIRLHGAPREVKPGTYHTTDLLRRPAATIVAWHLGEDAPEGIPGWLSERGHRLEAGALDVMGIPEACRQPEVRLEHDDGFAIVGHPDYVAGILDPPDAPPRAVNGVGDWVEIGEVKSQITTDDPAREDLAVEQALTYAGLLRAGASLHRPDGAEAGARPTRVRPVMAGLWDLDDAADQEINPAAADSLAEYVLEKAQVVHEAIQAGSLDRARAFDQERPPAIEDATGPAPVADEEVQHVADETVLAKAVMDYLEDHYDEGRDRFGARFREEWESAGEPDLADSDLDLRRQAPVGGRLQMWTKTETEEYPSEKLEELREETEQLEAELKELREAALDAFRAENAAALERLEDLQTLLAAEEEACTEKTKVPHYVRVVGQTDIDPQWALRELAADLAQDDEGGDA